MRRRRREKIPLKRTEDVRPAPASRTGAIRRANRAGANVRRRADTGAGAIRAKQGPAAFGAEAARTPPLATFAALDAAAGTERNETERRNGMRDTSGQGFGGKGGGGAARLTMTKHDISGRPHDKT